MSTDIQDTHRAYQNYEPSFEYHYYNSLKWNEMPIYIPFFLQYCVLSKLEKRNLENHIIFDNILDVQQSVDSEFVVKLYKTSWLV